MVGRQWNVDGTYRLAEPRARDSRAGERLDGGQRTFRRRADRRADIHRWWALLAPGDARLAARLAREAASVSHDGAAVDAAVLWAAMESEAFVCRDIERLLDVGLSHISPRSPIAALIADVRRWRRENADWRHTRALIENHYGYDKYPGHCHVVPNHAIMIMSILYAPDDFSRALSIVCTCGWDTDCNAGNVGCLMGAMLGLTGLDTGRDWRGPLADRMLISSADGGAAINDAVRVTYWLIDMGRALAGAEPLPRPKDGARFHFSLPGSLQGFRGQAPDGASQTLRNEAHDGERALALAYENLGGEPITILTPTFASRNAQRNDIYELMATPLISSGQVARAHVIAEAGNDREIEVFCGCWSMGDMTNFARWTPARNGWRRARPKS